ncbi:HipA family kinase [uncultured Arcticibacterium sp.]|uniref:HipA family kinase n=1 Tax=uncultured Arcticibacterium sp. TaxID=2173042 RepID=UPI0030F77575
MLNLTHEDYRLPEVFALEGLGLMETGTTAPMKIRGVDKSSNERGQYVVKFYNSGRMSVKSSCRELVGAWIARELGINVIEPVIVDVSPKFIELLLGKGGYMAAQKSVGLNFGSVYESGFMEFIEGKKVMENHLFEQAKLIFMFDMFVSNDDRGAGKPNVMTNGKELLVYDHELAFSFADLLSFSQNPEPWIIGESEREMYERHYFYKYLRSRSIDFMPLVSKLEGINDVFWQKVNSQIPEHWRTEDLIKIREYLTKIVENKEIFAAQLTKVLLS